MNCDNIFYEFRTHQWFKLDGDCTGNVREYKVEPDAGEVRALRMTYGDKRISGFFSVLCEAHLNNLRSTHPDWRIT